MRVTMNWATLPLALNLAMTAACGGDLPSGSLDGGGSNTDQGPSISDQGTADRGAAASSELGGPTPDTRLPPAPDTSLSPSPDVATGGQSCTGQQDCPANTDCLGTDYKCHPRCTPPTDPCGVVSNCPSGQACLRESPGSASAWCFNGVGAGQACSGTVPCAGGYVCSSVNGGAYSCHPVCPTQGAPCGTGGTCLAASGGCRYCSVPY